MNMLTKDKQAQVYPRQLKLSRAPGQTRQAHIILFYKQRTVL